MAVAEKSHIIQIFTEPPEWGHSKRCIWVERQNFYCADKPKGRRKSNKTTNEPYLILGFDTEYKSPSTAVSREAIREGNAKYKVLSYQFHAKMSSGEEWTGICCPDNDERLSIAEFLIFALGLGVHDFQMENIPTRIFLIGHFTRADIPAFSDFKEHKQYISNVRNTFLSTDTSLPVKIRDGNGDLIEMNIFIRDTMLLTPQSSKSLKELGALVGQPKIMLDPDPKIHHEKIQRMDQIRQNEWELFKQYAINDATICVRYIERIIDLYQAVTGNLKIPITLTSIGVDLLQLSWISNFDKTPEYIVGREVVKERVFEKNLGYFRIQSTEVPLERLSWDLDFITESYHGGRNEQFWFGPGFKDNWFDWDLSSAYPTAMSMIGMPQWEQMTPLFDLKNVSPTDLSFVCVDFQFPKNTRYPTLPVRTENGLIFPLCGRSYCASPEIVVAQSLGCKLKLIRGVNVPVDKTRAIFGEFIKQCIAKRIEAGSKTLTGLFWKELSNSTYGKTAQGLREKRVYNMRTSQTERLPPSKITNPCFASFITSFVRALLGEIMNSLPANKMAFSCTTDGFITNATAEDIEKCNHGTLAKIYRAARINLTGEAGMLEVKHRIALPLGWRTRGQATLERCEDFDEFEDEATILAKGGIYTKPESESDYEQNAEIVEMFFSRTPETSIRMETMTGIRDIVERDADLVPKEITKRLNMEFDWKRKPINYSDNKQFGHLCFETTSWNSVIQFQEVRRMWDEFNENDPVCLKNVDSYVLFANHVEARASMKEHSTYLRREDPDIMRLRLMLCSAWSRNEAGLDRKALGWSNAKFAEFLASQGIACRKTDVENGRKKTFVPNSVPRTKRVIETMNQLKKTLKTLDIQSFLYDGRKDTNHVSIL